MSGSRLCLIAAALLFAGSASMLCAQAVGPTEANRAKQYEVFGGYSFLSNSFNGHSSATSHQPLNGLDISVAARAGRGVSLKADASGFYGTSLGSPQGPIFVLGGLQYLAPVGREAVFVEGMLGYGHLNQSAWGGATPIQTSTFAWVAGGGVERELTPRTAFRLQGDLLSASFNIPDDQIHDLPHYFARLSAGFVWCF